MSATILLVDDEQDIREALLPRLSQLGHQIIFVKNVTEAVDALSSRTIDLIVSDIRMPGLPGVYLLDWVRARDPGLQPFLFMTGLEQFSIQELYAKGADGLLSKPFKRAQLVELIHRCLSPMEERWKCRPEAPAPSTNLCAHISGSLLSLGRGGFFLPITELKPQAPLPSVGQTVNFLITEVRGQMEISGTGVVRWIRRQPKANSGHQMTTLPDGIGVEIFSLSDKCRAEMIERINALTTKAYIPDSN